MQSDSTNAGNLEGNQKTFSEIGSNQYTFQRTESFNGITVLLQDNIPVRIVEMPIELDESKFNDELTFINISIENVDESGSTVYTAMMLQRELLFDGKLFGFDELNLTGIILPSGIYHGEESDNMPHGFGVFESKHYTYIGEFHNGEPVQRGIIKGEKFLENGSTVSGEVFNMQLDGICKVTFSNEDRYEGEFKLNHINGSGKYFYSEGSVYKGEFKNDLKHGKGIYYWNEKCWFEGTWENDKPLGKGKFHKENGDEINGVWGDRNLVAFIDKPSD